MQEKYEKLLQLISLDGLNTGITGAYQNAIDEKKKLDEANNLEMNIFQRKNSTF